MGGIDSVILAIQIPKTATKNPSNLPFLRCFARKPVSAHLAKAEILSNPVGKSGF
jgi:hypothetical protein